MVQIDAISNFQIYIFGYEKPVVQIAFSYSTSGIKGALEDAV
jgi:hypothetical protein